MKAPINSNKHIVQTSLTSVAESTLVNITIVNSLETVTPANASHVTQGAVVKAVYLEYWVMSEGAQPTFGNLTVEKLPGTSTDMTFNDSADLYSYQNKKNILFTTQGLIGDSNSNPIPIMRQWVKIPKGKQRFGLGDRLKVNVSCLNPTAGAGIEVCGTAIYKEYR